MAHKNPIYQDRHTARLSPVSIGLLGLGIFVYAIA